MGIVFDSKLEIIEAYYIIRIPLASSEKLPSRGMVMIEGTLNGVAFHTPLEPDGKGSHWFELEGAFVKDVEVSVGDPVSLSIEPINDWNEPDMPEDFMKAIHDAGLVNRWREITPKAKWDWLRFIRSTKNPSTHQRRIEVACSKLQKGDTRPCCFDRNRCTIMDVSKSGILID
ncbi:MAG: hypothetical protein CVU95_03140 [Firmicutes bacterium HGW-Firmicutes-2]|jgi:hypothetical protein|nr:MAG: hypothetical protein CVU95_03140 [Firmicutes bacterium HGW-Firmicutes-2]